MAQEMTPEARRSFLLSGTLERVTGIEPAFSAWEADVLPLNYTREVAEDTKARG